MNGKIFSNFKLYIAAFALFIIFPLILFSFKCKNNVDKIISSGEKAEKKGQYSYAARFYDQAYQSIDKKNEFLFKFLEFMQIETPSKSEMLYREIEMYTNSAISLMMNLKENPTWVKKTLEKEKLLLTLYPHSEAAQFIRKKTEITEKLQTSQSLYFDERLDDCEEFLTKTIIPDMEELKILKFLKMRLLGIVYFKKYKKNKKNDYIVASMKCFRECLPINSDDKILNRYYNLAEKFAEIEAMKKFPVEE